MITQLIAVIAPYEELAVQAEQLIRSEGFPAKVWRGDLDNGVKAARTALEQGAKIIVSHGETANIIQAELFDELPTEVIKVGPSWRHLVSKLHASASEGKRIAIAGFPRFANAARFAAESLDIPHRVFEMTTKEDAAETEWAITKWKADVVFGDVLSKRLLNNLPGINFHLIESNLDSVYQALDRAMLLVSNLKRMLTDNRRLFMVLERTLFGALIIDDDGVIEMVNQSAAALLTAIDPPFVGMHLSEVLWNSEIKSAVKEKREARGILIEYAGEQLHVNVMPLDRDAGGPYGFVVSLQKVENIVEAESQIRNKLHNKGFRARHSLRGIIHDSDSMRRVIRLAEAYAQSDANVVITGETGTGKELFAQGIHNASPRASGMFVAINCATLPATLLESELFGYSSGAFTGATRHGKMGLFELAHNGTIFLDEINEMDLHLQSHLLRAIQEREILRIGDNKTIPVNVRIVAAANKRLESEVAKGRLRQDLFFRLSVLNLHLPPLRERKGDVPLLFGHFLDQYTRRKGGKKLEPDKDTLHQLDGYSWPGNVRELENAAEKYVVLKDAPDLLNLFAVPNFDSEMEEERGSLDEIIRNVVRKTVWEESGNITRAAQRLQINRNTLRRWLRREE